MEQQPPHGLRGSLGFRFRPTAIGRKLANMGFTLPRIVSGQETAMGSDLGCMELRFGPSVWSTPSIQPGTHPSVEPGSSKFLSAKGLLKLEGTLYAEVACENI